MTVRAPERQGERLARVCGTASLFRVATVLAVYAVGLGTALGQMASSDGGPTRHGGDQVSASARVVIRGVTAPVKTAVAEIEAPGFAEAGQERMELLVVPPTEPVRPVMPEVQQVFEPSVQTVVEPVAEPVVQAIVEPVAEPASTLTPPARTMAGRLAVARSNFTPTPERENPAPSSAWTEQVSAPARVAVVAPVAPRREVTLTSTEVEPEPEPVVQVEPQPEPVVQVAPQSEPVVQYEPQPEIQQAAVSVPVSQPVVPVAPPMAQVAEPVAEAAVENPYAGNRQPLAGLTVIEDNPTQGDLALLQPPADSVLPKNVEMRRPVAPMEQLGPFEVRGHSEEITVLMRRSKMLRTKFDVYRTAVVDPDICDVMQFTPREISLVGKKQGATDVTFWFEDGTHEPVTYLVRVSADPEVQERREQQFEVLEDVIAELFPESKVKLIPVSGKLIVNGQARDAEEAAQIMAVIRGETVLNYHGLVQNRNIDPQGADENGNQGIAATQVINMLMIPGVQQVALKVKIAELNRSAARNMGVDLDLNFDWSDGAILIQSLLNMATGGNGVISGTFDNGNLNFGLNYLQKNGVVRMLSEPTLVTLSGKPATFLAGGEFAVPTTVGVGGASAVTTDFRAYGAIVTFLPVVLDKDHIRLEVAPEFSQIDNDNTVNGTPGLNTRAVTTTVEMREGQTLAIAGLLDDSMKGENTGNLPIVAKIFGRREVTRNETELIILVTPELVHPMEPEAVPPLPGFDVTEPTNCEFYLKGDIEGRPTHEYRSTVWPTLRRRYQAGGPAMISGPFGHGD